MKIELLRGAEPRSVSLKISAESTAETIALEVFAQQCDDGGGAWLPARGSTNRETPYPHGEFWGTLTIAPKGHP